MRVKIRLDEDVKGPEVFDIPYSRDLDDVLEHLVLIMPRWGIETAYGSLTETSGQFVARDGEVFFEVVVHTPEA